MKELLRLQDAPLKLEVGWRITDPGTWHLLPSRGINMLDFGPRCACWEPWLAVAELAL